MGRSVIGVAAASAGLLVACNMLSGVDGLETSSASEQADTGTRKPAALPGAPEQRDHAAPPSGGSSSGSTTTPVDDAGIDAASEAAASLPTFNEDFNRPNSSAVGGGWLEKSIGKFPLVNGASQQNETGIYRNLFVARPASEDVLDVLVSTTVTLGNTVADPCLFARIQGQASAVRDHFVGYSVYPDGPLDLYISRDDGTLFNDVGSASISPALVPGQSYRLSLQVTGTNPVHLVGSISKPDGSVIASITTNDANAKRITTAGAVGYGSSMATGARWDDFRRVTLPAP